MSEQVGSPLKPAKVKCAGLCNIDGEVRMTVVTMSGIQCYFELSAHQYALLAEQAASHTADKVRKGLEKPFE